MNRVDYAQKVLHHVAKAEKWQGVADHYEKWAEAEAERQAHGRLTSRLGRQTPVAYRAKILLEDHFWYKRAVSLRDAHEAQAKIYQVAMAAVKEIEEAGK